MSLNVKAKASIKCRRDLGNIEMVRELSKWMKETEYSCDDE